VYRSNPAVENVVCFKAAPINAGAFYKNQIDKGIRNLCRGSLALGEKIKWQQVGVGEYTDREIIDFGFQLINKIQSVKPHYSVWASEAELNFLNEMRRYTQLWQSDYSRYLETREKIPSFDEFLEKLEFLMLEISTSIRCTL
jgi:hypothetical protein